MKLSFLIIIFFLIVINCLLLLLLLFIIVIYVFNKNVAEIYANNRKYIIPQYIPQIKKKR